MFNFCRRFAAWVVLWTDTPMLTHGATSFRLFEADNVQLQNALARQLVALVKFLANASG